MKEQKLELQGTHLAKAMGFIVHKMTDSSGVPDKLYVKAGRCFYVEWKKPTGGRISKDQNDWAVLIKENGTKHFFCNSLEGFRQALLEFENADT